MFDMEELVKEFCEYMEEGYLFEYNEENYTADKRGGATYSGFAVPYVDLAINGEEWSIFQSYEDAHAEATDRLIDEPYFWKMAVADDDTQQGLEDWARDVAEVEQLASYDGDYQELPGGGIAVRTN